MLNIKIHKNIIHRTSNSYVEKQNENYKTKFALSCRILLFIYSIGNQLQRMSITSVFLYYP